MGKTYRRINQSVFEDHTNPQYVKALRNRMAEIQERENSQRDKQSLKNWMFQ